MASNYLELRATVAEGTGIKLPPPAENLKGKDDEVGLRMFKSVKEGAKVKN